MTRQYTSIHHVYGIIGVFLVLTTAGAAVGALEWDEGSFLLNSQHLLGTGENFEESRPHTLSYLITGIWAVTGESTFVARLLVVLSGTLCILLVHRIAADAFDDPLPVTTAFAFTPLLLYWSFHVYTDVPAMVLVYLGWFLYRRDRHLLAGVAMAGAATVRYVFAMFALGMAAAYLFQYRDRLPRYVTGGLLGTTPFFAYSHVFYGGVLSRVQMYVTRVAEWSGSGPFTATAASAWSAAVMLSVLLPAAVIGRNRTPVVEKTMILTYAAFFLFVSGNAFHRYWLPIVPFLLFMAYRGLGEDRNLFLPVAVAMILLSGVAVGIQFSEQQLCSDPFTDAVHHVDGQDDVGAVVSDQWAVTGYLLDQNVYSPWTDYETLQEEHGVTHVITREELDYDVQASFANPCWTYYVYRLS